MESEAKRRILHEWILDYMIQNNMTQTAAIFAQEANVPLDVPMTGEGLLEEWWNTHFWDTYASILSRNPEAMEISSSSFSTDRLHQNATDQNTGNRWQNISLEFPRPMNRMLLQNTSPRMGNLDLFPNRGRLSEEVLQELSWREMSYLLQNPARPVMWGRPAGLHNHPQMVHSTSIPRLPTMVDFRQIALPMWITQSPNMANMPQSAHPMMTTPSSNMAYLPQSSHTMMTTPSPNMANMPQSAHPMMTTPSSNMANLPQSAHTMMTTPSPNMANLPQSAIPTTAQRQELDPNSLGSRSSLDSNAGNSTAASRQGRERPSSDSREKTKLFRTK